MWYFAYGSNMNEARVRDERKIPYTRRISGKLFGYSLLFNKQSSRNPREGFANIERVSSSGACSKGGANLTESIVEGVLYLTNSEGIKILDGFEGYPTQYDKREVVVHLNDGTAVSAITYIAVAKGEGLKPVKSYVAHLLAGEDLLSKEYFSFIESTPLLENLKE